MKRTDFLKKLSGAAVFMLLPIKKLATNKKTCLLEFHIRGFQYYYGPDLVHRMNPGESLVLVREPRNPYDKNAIALYFRNRKIGFVPREKNEVISRLIDSNAIAFTGEILKVEKDAPPWEALTVGICFVKENAWAA